MKSIKENWKEITKLIILIPALHILVIMFIIFETTKEKIANMINSSPIIC